GAFAGGRMPQRIAPFRSVSNGSSAPSSPEANDTCSGSELAPRGGRGASYLRSATPPVRPSTPRAGANHPDFNGDGVADLAIAEACLDSPGGVMDAGAVFVEYGGANGLDVNAGPGSQFWTENS